jgi:hypothetical protein
MLKLIASYGKKLPVEGLDYSSHNYHASVEVELPDGLDRAELNRRIHDTFALARESVDAELHAETRPMPAMGPIPPQQQRPGGNGNQFQPQRRRNSQPASAKQLNYLRDIAARKGMDAGELDQLASTQFGAETIARLSRDQASRLIDWLGSANTGQAA